MRLSIFIVLSGLLSATLAWGQATAQIHGVVQDTSGAAVPGAKVKATQTETGLSRTVTSEADGGYILTNLPLGPYNLEVTKEGFATAVQSGITLQVSSDPAIPVALKVGAVSERVNVEANATQVETSQVGVGAVIESQRIVDLPLNGRQPTDLITLNGVAVQTGNSPSYMMNSGVSISVAGGTSYSVQYNLDGAQHVEVWGGTNLPLPFPEALQEFKLVTSTQDASSGGHSSASVNSVTKSGTNAFHGDLFEFLRNGDLNGRDFFAPTNDQLKRNQFGGVIGGPIKKDRLFFFVGYQGTITRQTSSSTVNFVPTAKMVAGDFSDYVAANCPEATRMRPSLSAGNQLTLPISPAARNIAAFFPKTSDPCGRVFTGTPLSENRLQVPVRLDYQINDRQSFFARYLVTRIDAKVPYDINHDILQATVQVGNDDLAQSLALGHTFVISSTTVNSFRISGNRIGADHATPAFFAPADVGVKNFFTYIPKFMPISIVGDAQIGFGANFFAGPSAVTSYGANDDISIVRGSHQFSFGGSIIHATLISNSLAWSAGTFLFTGALTGSPMIDFLTGKVTQIHQGSPNPQYLNQDYVSLYAADVWKATRRLTLNYGLRWNPFFPGVFRQGDVTSFSLDNFYKGIRSQVIPGAPAGFTYPGDPGFNGKSAMPKELSHFEPRVGFAWDPFGDGKTAVRGGGGIAFDFMRMDVNVNTSTDAPFRQTIITPPVSLDNPYANVAGGNPFPYFFDSKNPSYPQLPRFQGLIVIPPNLQTPQQYSWNLGVQRQITPNLFASATYIGSHLIHLISAVDLNAAQFAPGATTANVDARRLLEQTNPNQTQHLIGSLTQMDDGGTQGYNGLLLNSTWRKGSVNLSGNYSWSHCIGLSVIGGPLNVAVGYPHEAGQNNGPVDRKLDYSDCTGNAVSDVRHIANATFVATTPKFSNGLMRRLASGWTFSTIYTIRTGIPITVATGVDRAVNGLFVAAGAYPYPQRPNQVLADTASPAKGQSCSPAPCVNDLNPAAFAQPAIGTYGNMAMGPLKGPGFWEWDQTISRQFKITENQRLEIRAEAFNVTNSVRFAAPITANLNISSGNFGRITTSTSTTGATSTGNGLATGNGGRIMQFALKYIF